MTVVLHSRKDFTLENYRRVAVDGESVRVGPVARKAMAAARKSFMALLDSDRTQFIYGTTSGGGPQAKVPIPPAEQRRRAAAAARRRNGGSGFGGGYLDDRVVRGMIFARLANFIEGNAKTRPVIAERVASMLDAPLPQVPFAGQVGAGEILPLAHVLSALPVGDTQEAEPMALVNGSPTSAALIADTALHARNRLDLAERVFALSIEAFNAPLVAYDADLEKLWDTRHEREALRALNGYLRGVPRRGRRFYQAPVSYRILPRVLAQGHRAVEQVEETARISLASVTDNPVYVLPTREHPLGRAFSTGGYHNGMAYPAMNKLAASWADLASLADRHTTKMHNPAVSLLPPGLMRSTGPDTFGTGGLGFIQVHFGEAARHAAARTFLPPSEGGGYAQNDVASPTFIAYANECQAGECLDAAVAILAAVASQALWATERPAPPVLAEFLDGVRAYFPPVDGVSQRRPGWELEQLAAAFSASALSGSFDPPGTSSQARPARPRPKAVRRRPTAAGRSTR